jgi:hypothetical protein
MINNSSNTVLKKEQYYYFPPYFSYSLKNHTKQQSHNGHKKIRTLLIPLGKL